MACIFDNTGIYFLSGGNDDSDEEIQSSESVGRECFTVGEALEIAKNCGKSSIAAKNMCEEFMSQETLGSSSLEKERQRLFGNVAKRLDYIINKKRKGKFQHDKEGLEEPFLSRAYNTLLSSEYKPESSSESEDGDGVSSLGKKFGRMDSPSSSPRRKDTSAKKKETKDASVQVDVREVSSRYKPPISEATQNAIQKRSKKLSDQFGKMCVEQGVEDPKELLGLLLYYYSYRDGSGLANVGMKLYRGEPILAQHKV